jgi:hypothetical protein
MKYMVLLGFVLLSSLCLSQRAGPSQDEQPRGPPTGYVEAHVQDVQIELSRSVVLLEDVRSNSTLNIYMSRGQGENIYAALHNITFIRPRTHDLIMEFLRVSGLGIRYVSIDDLEDGIYYATLMIEGGERSFTIDARPSDSIVVALLSGAPIYVKKDLLEAGRRKGPEFPGTEA